MNHLKKRLKDLFSFVNSRADVILVPSIGKDILFRHLTNVRNGLFDSDMMVVKKNRIFLLMSDLEIGCLSRINEKHVIVERWGSKDELLGLFGKHLKGCRKIGINNEVVSVRQYDNLKRLLKNYRIIRLGNEIAKSFLIKDDFAVNKIKKSCNLASRIANDIPNILKQGMTEKDLWKSVRSMIEDNNAVEAFDTVVAFGSNSAKPHSTPTNKKLCKNDLVLVDFGAKLDNYMSDITVSMIYKSKDDFWKNVYDVVLESQKRAFEKIRPGVKFKDIDLVARNFIKDKLKKDIPHAIGHGFGLRIHENPSVSFRSKDVVREGMVFTIEPGVYIKDKGGIRIEDDVLVTKNGFEKLTNVKRRFLVS